MVDQYQIVFDQWCWCDWFEIVDIVLGMGELQQFGDDQLDLVYLFVNQLDFWCYWFGCWVEDVVQDIEVVEDDGYWIVDFMGDFGGQLVDGGEFFVYYQL